MRIQSFRSQARIVFRALADPLRLRARTAAASASRVGLSEITRFGNSFIVIERDNRTGDFGELKTLVKFTFGEAADGVVSRDEKSVFDLVPAMLSSNGWITDKPEGVAVTRNGAVYVVTDNDGVDGWSGETSFLRLGNQGKLFR